MKEYVSVKELLEEVDAMAKRGTLLARGGVTQEELAMQIKGLIVHVAAKDEADKIIKELIEKCIVAVNKLPNCPNGHSGVYDKATIERVLRNVIDD